jgi:hypothetical protein
MQNFDHNIGFWEKNANFFAENCRKSQKIVIITTTPGCAALVKMFVLFSRSFVRAKSLRSLNAKCSKIGSAQTFLMLTCSPVFRSSHLVQMRAPILINCILMSNLHAPKIKIIKQDPWPLITQCYRIICMSLMFRSDYMSLMFRSDYMSLSLMYHLDQLYFDVYIICLHQK